MGLFSSSKNPKGYGPIDRKMARDLAKAKGKGQEEADRIARAYGHHDAPDARSWLRERS